MDKNVLVILAEGFEEIEAVTIVDVLRRAELNVSLLGLTTQTIRGAHNVVIEADGVLGEIDKLPDALVLPGGMPGSENLGASQEVKVLLLKMHDANKLIGAICAAPGCVLAKHGVLAGKNATCYPGFEKHFGPETRFSENRVVKDGNIITSRGPGSALEFSYALAEELAGKPAVSSLKEGMLALF